MARKRLCRWEKSVRAKAKRTERRKNLAKSVFGLRLLEEAAVLHLKLFSNCT